MYLWYSKKKEVNVGNPRHKNTVSGSVLCRHDREMLAKSADIWLSRRHLAGNVPDIPSQGIADPVIIDDKLHPVDGPARNSRSQTQVRTIKLKKPCGPVSTTMVKQRSALSRLATQHYGKTPPTCSTLSSTKPRAILWECGTS
jgi:hypothetical protein